MPPHFDSPNGLEFTLEDLKNCGWEAALKESEGESYASNWSALTRKAEEAESQGHLPESKALTLLSHICSMMLKPENRNEPFQPAVVFSDGRSAIPGDFTETEINLLDQFVDGVDDFWMKARIADLLWLRQMPRNPKFALEAIDAYRSIPLNGKTWASGVLDCWRRAISLSFMIGKGADNRLSEMESAVWSLFRSATAKEKFFALRLAEVLEEYNLGRSNEHSVATHLRSIAEEIKAEERPNSARTYFANATVWFGKANDETESVRMTVAHARDIREGSRSQSGVSVSKQHAGKQFLRKSYPDIPEHIPRMA